MRQQMSLARHVGSLAAVWLATLLAGCGSTLSTRDDGTLSTSAIRSETAGPAPTDPDQLLAELAERYQGQWSNQAEVFAASENGQQDAASSLVSQQIEAIRAPQFGRRVFRVRISFGAPGQQRQRLRLTRFAYDSSRSLVRQDVYGFPDANGYIQLAAESEAWAELSPDRLRPSPGCSIWWQRRDNGRWVGATDPGQCAAAELGESTGSVTEWLQLDADAMRYQQVRQVAEGQTAVDRQFEFQRARSFTGWFALHPQGDKATTAPAVGAWHTGRNLQLHDQGGSVVLPRGDGTPSGYRLELARLHYPGQARSFLRLSFIDANQRSLGYVFATDDARDIGVNLGWLQVGLQAQPAVAR
ncbi:MAG: CpcT/CpeT family chromophore lyase [Lysobacterales bacterium]